MGSSEPVDLDALRMEIETVAKARSRERIDLSTVPLLASLASERSVDSVLMVIAEGCAALDETKSAATEPLLADTSSRWETKYRARATIAAANLGVGSYHTARDRKTPTGLSHLDRLYGQVADAILANAKTAPAVKSEIDGSLTRFTKTAVALFGVVVLAIGVGAWAVTGGNKPADTVPAGPVNARGCIAPGDPSGFAVTSPATSAAIRSLAESQQVDLCSEGELLIWDGLHIQPVSSNGRTWGAVVVSESLTDVGSVLRGGHWYSYSRVGERDIPQRVGVPSGEFSAIGRGWSLETSGPDLLVGADRDGIFYWLPQRVAAMWLDEGAWDSPLGGPVSNPYSTDAGIRVDFQGGYVAIPDLDGQPRAVSENAQELSAAELAEFGGRLVITTSGTRWLIDSNGHRWWAPDERLWDCAGGDANLAASDLSDRTLSWLVFGGVLECPVDVPGGSLGGGLDLALYCHDERSPDHVAVVVGSTWVCAEGESVEPVAVDEACRWQYGPKAIGFSEAGAAFSWRCRNS